MRFYMRAILPIIPIAGMVFLGGCKRDTFLEIPSVPPGQTWVAKEPIQCLGNEWEIDWLERHDHDYSSYPRDINLQADIIKDFYARQGVKIYDVRREQKYFATCDACSCPEGHTLYLMVRTEDTETMRDFGFRIEAPPRPKGF